MGSGKAFGLQLLQRAFVIFRHDLDELAECIGPIAKDPAGALAAGVEMVAFEQEAQALR